MTLSPTLLRRYIALELRRLRVASGLRRDQTAARLRCALSHVTHLETMRNLPRAAELEVLLDFYGAGERAPAFLELLDAARGGCDWWSPFRGTEPDWFDLFLAMEASAARIESYDPMVVPGLLQTPGYAAAVITAGQPGLPAAELRRRVELRLARQAVLDRCPAPPQVRCVLDESVLLRAAAPAGVLAEQLRRLVALSRRRHVRVQVLPLAAGLHAGLDGGITALAFPPELSGDPGVAYVDNPFRGTYCDRSDEVRRCRNTLARVRSSALDPDASRARLARRLKEIT